MTWFPPGYSPSSHPGLVPPVRPPVAVPWPEQLRQQLLEHRIVLLVGPLDDAMAARLAAELMGLDASGDDEIELRIDSSGGGIGAALAVMDVISLSGVDIHATCTGRADGPALGVLAMGHRRSAVRSARFRLREHLPTTPTGPVPLTDAMSALEWRAKELEAFRGRLAERCEQDEQVFADLLASGADFGVGDAQRLGLIDAVLLPEQPPAPSRPLGFLPAAKRAP